MSITVYTQPIKYIVLEIILIPVSADFLVLFNQDNGNYESISIPKKAGINGGYIANCVYDRYLFLFGGYQ